MRILIVGGGTGGTIIANNLARRLAPEIRKRKASITLLSASDKHMYQPGLLYVAFGQMMPDELYRDQASLLETSVDFHVDPVEDFLLDQNRVKTKGGAIYDYDTLVIATGSRTMANKIPGLEEGAESFYTEAGAISMFKKLREFEGGKIAMVVGVPHKCPIAPVEAVFSLHDYFIRRGIRDKVEIKYHYPINRIHSIENVALWAKPQFDEMGIEYETLFNLEEVDV
ncbi:MAG TPA: NAD(P)/FAD-dependent oxidoreductase, partial [Gammaproteobacteria bacterium]|nr:NAD(P)/FAD-dependent oxidoreductase [Gammaproteobacteria bacterium]